MVLVAADFCKVGRAVSMEMPRSPQPFCCAVEELRLMSQHALQTEADVLMVLRVSSLSRVESPVWET